MHKKNKMSISKNIMIVDDDEGILDAVGMLLKYKGYEVTTCTNGNTILSMENHFPDLVLLDIWMSGTDGRNVCKQLKTRELTKAIPVIMVSASKDIERSAIESGADGFLAKPFEISELINTIEQHTAHLAIPSNK